MKRLITSLGWMMLLLPLISVAGTTTLLKSINTSSSITEDRQVSNFEGLSSGGAFDIFVKFGATESLKIEGDQDDISQIETVVEDGVLKVRYKKSLNSGWFKSHKKVNVYIIARNLSSLTVSGSGSIKIDGVLKADQLTAKVSGSGNINLTTDTRSFAAAISGSGGISGSGNAGTATISVSGSGNFNGKDLHTKKTDIKVSGSGNATIIADDSLNAIISGSGNIRYSGKAQVTSIKKSGSGSVSKI